MCVSSSELGPPLPQASVSPPEPNGEGTHSLAGEWMRGSNSYDWRKIRALCLLCAVQCPDGSDEASCCGKDDLRCSDGSCVGPGQLCDGKEDCPLGEDEKEGLTISCIENRFCPYYRLHTKSKAIDKILWREKFRF